jgi:hypothetical protein
VKGTHELEVKGTHELEVKGTHELEVKSTHELEVKDTHELLISADEVQYERCLSKKVWFLILKIAGDTITGLNEAYSCLANHYF